MKIFLVERTDKVDWGCCRAYVAVAESKHSALDLGPEPENRKNYAGKYGFWVGRDMWPTLKVTCLGEASSEFVERCLVLTDFITE